MRPAPLLALKPGLAPRVDIWWRCLDVDDETCARLTSLLSPDEQRHAARFHFAIDRSRYCIRRGILRELIAQRLGRGPREIAIALNAFGKPYVEGSDVRFSLSHSRGMALYASARGAEIGCDVEWRDPRFANSETAESILSRVEIETWQALPERQRTQAFFDYWTCKEAYLKARGVGFALPARDITVSLVGPPRFVALPDDDPGEWSLTRMDPAPGYAGMLAVRGAVPIVQLR